MFRNPFYSEGRICRLEYGLSCLIYACVYIAVHFTKISLATSPVLFLVLELPLFWFILAQGAKRCHDIGKSGSWQFIPFYSFWMLFADGVIGNNQYGPNPKGLYYDESLPEEKKADFGPIDDVDEDGIIKPKE
ncbi:uncharacterized membrane protein YhaH (DUF805 family) [Pedobacter sp. UYP24]